MALRGMEVVNEMDAGEQPKAGLTPTNLAGEELSSSGGYEVPAVVKEQTPPMIRGAQVEDLAEAGFEGTDEDDPLAYPMISLKDDNFKDREGNDYGTTFDVVFLAAKNKFIIKPFEKSEDHLAYAYGSDADNKVPSDFSSSGAPMAQLYKKWVSEGVMQEGAKPVIKRYVEIMAALVSEAGEEKESVVLSISPTSTGEYALFVKQTLRMHGLLPPQYVTRVSTGPQVSSGIKKFRKWKFQFLHPLMN